MNFKPTRTGSDFSPGDYPNIKPLVQLRAIESRLTKLVDELRAGPR